MFADATEEGAPAPAQRADALLAGMTLEERMALLRGQGWGAADYVGQVQWSVQNTTLARIPWINLNDGPQGFRCNGLGKCPGGTSTQFPSGLTVAASWSRDSAFAWGDAMGTEFFGKGANVQLGPGMCLARVPRNGRNFEYMSGEDPFLGRALTPHTISGIQGRGVVANAKHFILNNQETKRNSIDVQVDERTLHEVYLPPFEGAVDAGVGSIMCSCELMAAQDLVHSATTNSLAPPLLLLADNKIGGRWSCEQNSTLNTALRDDLGFQGWVMSDWRATHSTSIDDGLDQEMPGSTYMNAKALANKPAAVETSARRILTALFAAGVFDANNTNSIAKNVSTAASMRVAQQLAENSTVLVQNKDGLLPLAITPGTPGTTTSTTGTVVSTIVLVGSGATKPQTGGGGSGMVNPSVLPTPLASLAALVTAKGGAVPNNCSAAAWEDGVDFHSTTCQTGNAAGTGAADCCAQCAAMGDACLYFSYKKSDKECWFKTCDAGRKSNPNIISGKCHGSDQPGGGGTQVVYAATAADAAKHLGKEGAVAVVFVSQYSAEGSDRGGLAYSSADEKMITDVAATAGASRTIVVANAPGAVTMPWASSVGAILLPFYPGQMFGVALARLLLGDVSPSGRLPLTLPNKENEMGWTQLQWPGVDGKVSYDEKLEVGYRWYDSHGVVPAYAFGHGLTYSAFAYGALKVETATTAAAAAAVAAVIAPTAASRARRVALATPKYTVSFTLANTGGAAAAEVAQMYLGFPAAAGEPPRLLAGFEKVFLAPGASSSVSFALSSRDLSVWDVGTHAWTEVSGIFNVTIGASSRDLRQSIVLHNQA